ncbi:hypothetical protein RHI9324_03468 [Rhizobium sp. CECT 9324]|nr:hypothetical protein RHI9324_03468 [Rhizobium sp. CECT 9324]
MRPFLFAATQKHSTIRLTINIASLIFNRMVEQYTHDMNLVFHALGDATRRQMLHDLANGERTVSDLAQPYEMSLAAASKHIKVLESAGLIRREIRGRTHLCRLDPGPLATAHEWLNFYQRFWTSRLDTLERLLRRDDDRQTSTGPEKQHRPENQDRPDNQERNDT